MSKRVYALLDGDQEQLRLIGFGQYVGDFIPEGAVGPMARFAAEQGIENPKIVLDNGEVVWGCECWWGPEEDYAKLAEGKTIINVDMGAKRAKVDQ